MFLNIECCYYGDCVVAYVGDVSKSDGDLGHHDQLCDGVSYEIEGVYDSASDDGVCDEDVF